MTTMASAVLPASLPSVHPSRLAATGGVALLLNLAVFAAGSLAGASWEVGQPYPLTVLSVVAATVVAFAVGGVVTWLIARRRPGFVTVAAWGGLGFGLVSMLGLLNAADLTTAVSLGLMHLITAGAWVLSLLWKPAARS